MTIPVVRPVIIVIHTGSGSDYLFISFNTVQAEYVGMDRLLSFGAHN